MGSRKEEERNEKIIRGLMKLPPNRRCINCNSLGPQYVCTNFWTFVCVTCSGIHREFTHRVKSVSMAKFTSQEVEALQNGGNQRAREVYLKDWDLQRQRLPDNSNVNKVREFIKNVYVDRRYAGGKTSEKPLKDAQVLGSHTDDTRRASSYHSYSQSPPYDYQYEDRRYGKQGSVLTRKPGSDRSHYIGKISGFVYSPGRMSEQMFEDRFANEGSGLRISDYSVSSGGDPFRSGAQSPNFEKDVGFNSPPIRPSRDIVSSVANLRRDVDGIPRPQRTTSLGSMGSFGSNSMSLKSYNSGLADVSEPEQSAEAHQDKMSTFPQSQTPVNYGGLDLFQSPVVPEPVSSAAPPIDLFQLPATSSAPVNTIHMTQASSTCVDLFQEPAVPEPVSSASPPIDLFQLPATSSAPVNTIHTTQASSTCVDLFQEPAVPEPVSSASPPIDLFQLPATSSAPVNMVTSHAFSASLMNSCQPAQTSSPSSLNFFEILQQPSSATLDRNPQELSNPKNEGWATFDTPSPAASIPGTENVFPATVPGNGGSSVNFDPFPSSNTGMQWPAFQNSGDRGPSLSSDPWFNSLHDVQAPAIATSTQSWNAFDDSTTGHLSFGGVEQTSEPLSAAYKPSSTADQYLNSIVSQDSNDDENPKATSHHGPSGLYVPSHVDMGPPYTPSILPLVGEVQVQATQLKSTNPFDFACDSDLEQSNMFLDMSSLQAALPNTELSSTFLGGATQSWFPQNTVMPFVPAAAQGGLAYMPGQSPTAPLPNAPTQEPVASVGGNPFA